MKKFLIGLLTHFIALCIGFAVGIYTLPILTAPESPHETLLTQKATQALFSAQIKKDLPGNDFLHWGEGRISLTANHIIHEGKLSPGPDYKLYLIDTFVAHEDDFLPIKHTAKQIGDIKNFNGFIIDIPSDINIKDYNTVVIWCEAFAEFITAVQYR